jgi:hypothetical protein
VARLAPQPAEKGALEQLGVEPVGLGPAVLAGDGDARGVDDMGLDAPGAQPARQPEAVAAGLVGHRDACDRLACLGRLVLPAPQKPQQRLLVRLDLLQRMAIEAGHDGGHEPARLAHLDDGDDGAGLLEGYEGPAQVIRLRHGDAPSAGSGSDGAPPSPRLHSFSTSVWTPTPAGSSPPR